MVIRESLGSSDDLVLGVCANEVLVTLVAHSPMTTALNGSPMSHYANGATVKRLVLFHDVYRYENLFVRKRAPGEHLSLLGAAQLTPKSHLVQTELVYSRSCLLHGVD